MRLSPLDPRMVLAVSGMAMAHLVAGSHAEAMRWAQRAVDEDPSWAAGYRLLAAAQSMLGEPERARETVQALLARMPDARISDGVRGYRDPAFRGRFTAALRDAGLPD